MNFYLEKRDFLLTAMTSEKNEISSHQSEYGQDGDSLLSWGTVGTNQAKLN